MITGASGVGKTSLAAILADKLALPLIPEVARLLCDEAGYSSPAEIADQQQFRTAVLDRQISEENAAAQFIADRCAIDCWVMWQRWHICSAMSFDTEQYYERARAQALTYDRVIYIPPMFVTPDDSFRWTDKDYIKQIDRLTRMTLFDWQLNELTLTIDSEGPESRAQQVLEWLR